MAIAEAARFANDLAKGNGLAERIKPRATGLAALTAAATAFGYDFTVEELRQVIRGASGRDLSEAQLEAIAGGSGQGGPPGENAAVVAASMELAVVQLVSSTTTVVDSTVAVASTAQAVILVS